MHFGETRRVTRIFRLAVGVGIFVLTTSQNAGGQQSTKMARDTSLLSAILTAAMSDLRGEKLRVDPRPLVAREGVEEVRSEDIASISPAVASLRAAIIRAFGLRTVDATKVNQNRDCPGALVLGKPDSLGRHTNAHVGCTKESFYVLAIGLPRPGRDLLARDSVYDRDNERAGRGYWSARVIRTAIGPGGSNLNVSDYVLTRRTGTWVVIRIIGLSYSE
jgi:hypothetical protein